MTFNHSRIYLSAHILGRGGSRVSVLRHRWSARGGPKSSWRFAYNVDVKDGAESIAWKQHAERGNQGKSRKTSKLLDASNWELSTVHEFSIIDGHMNIIIEIYQSGDRGWASVVKGKERSHAGQQSCFGPDNRFQTLLVLFFTNTIISYTVLVFL